MIDEIVTNSVNFFSEMVYKVIVMVSQDNSKSVCKVFTKWWSKWFLNE